MTQEERDEKNKKLREKYHQKKDEKNAKRREQYHEKKKGKAYFVLGIQYSYFVFRNSVLPFFSLFNI
jgi:hypothetical protein